MFYHCHAWLLDEFLALRNLDERLKIVHKKIRPPFLRAFKDEKISCSILIELVTDYFNLTA